MTATQNSAGHPWKLNSLFILHMYDKYYNDNLTKIYFSARWLVRADLQNQDIYSPCPDWNRARIRDSQVELRQSRLSWDSWTLFRVLGRSRDMLPWKKLEIWGLPTAGNAFKLSILSSPPHYFRIILNLLWSHQVDIFGFWGVCAHPMHPLPTGLEQGELVTHCKQSDMKSKISQTMYKEENITWTWKMLVNLHL